MKPNLAMGKNQSTNVLQRSQRGWDMFQGMHDWNWEQSLPGTTQDNAIHVALEIKQRSILRIRHLLWRQNQGNIYE